MLKFKETKPRAKIPWPLPPSLSQNMIIMLLAIIGGSILLSTGFAIARSHHAPVAHAVSKTVATNGASIWTADTTVTAPVGDFSPPSAQALHISTLFKQYYDSHSGPTGLGAPITVAFPTRQGWIQFFRWGALLSPSYQRGQHGIPEDSLLELTTTGIRDPASGLVRLSLIQALLTDGSQIPIAGQESSLTYADLRKAANPELMLPAPAKHPGASLSSPQNQGVFVKGGTRGGKDVGHLISESFWNYIHRPDVSPDGWEVDFGAPLTEALPFTFTKNGAVHHALVQLFWRNGVILEQNDLNPSIQPEINLLDTSLAYLRTVGPPAVALNMQQAVWTQGNTSLFDTPTAHQVVAHIGQHFPLTLLGETTWEAGMLWYRVQWTVPKRAGTGWASALNLTFTSPGSVTAQASIDALSSDLAAYLANYGNSVGVAIHDVTRKRSYTYNVNTSFTTGSSIKVPIMLALFNMTEQQGREPNDYEMDLLTTMIENSNNDSAGILYQEIGDAAGLASYLQKIRITSLTPYPGAFGWSQISPLAMMNLLTLLYQGKILTAHDRAQALFLMEHIEADQQIGVGDTAPSGSVVAMKDGWVIGPDGLWTMNSSGILTRGQETYIISVYTQDLSSLPDGQAIAQHVCGTIASLLT